MNNEEIVAHIQDGENVNDNLMELYGQNKGFIYKCIQRYTGYMELEDLWQEAFIALCEAVSSYEPKCGTFINWLSNTLKYHLYAVTDNTGASMPEHIRFELITYKRFVDYYRAHYGDYPSDSMIMSCLKINHAELNKLKKAEAGTSCISIYEPIGDELTIADTLRADYDTDSIDDAIDSEIDSQIIRDTLSELEDIQRAIIDMYFYEGLTTRQISEALNTSESHTRDIKKRALRQLRDRFKELHLFEERAYSKVYRGTYQRYKYTQTSTPEAIALKMLEHT